MRITTVGDRALLVEVADAAEALSLSLWARERGPAAEEVVPAARSVLFAGVGDLAALGRAIAAWRPAPAALSGPLVEVPVRYDGADLDAVARAWGMTRAEAVATHSSVQYVAEFCGFAPGFAYLAGLPAELAVPRLTTPRPQVPAGAVAVADVWTGIYPTSSPGGWRLLGSTDAVLWDQTRAEPALLPPGTRVRLVSST